MGKNKGNKKEKTVQSQGVGTVDVFFFLLVSKCCLGEKRGVDYIQRIR